MPDDRLSRLPNAPASIRRRAVIDIGSNTVRLAIFQAPAPDHRRVLDEKARCRLAEGLDETGALSPAGVVKATDAIAGYVALAARHGVSDLQLVATAAVREASDGGVFAGMLEERFGYPIRILDGEEEAVLAARGIMSGVPDLPAAGGLVADLGGGSLEIAEVGGDHGTGRLASLPLGHIRLDQKARGDLAVLNEIIAWAFANVMWLDGVQIGRVYLAGGAFRDLARRHMKLRAVPSNLDGYGLCSNDFRRFHSQLRQQIVPDRHTLGPLIIAAQLVDFLLAKTGAASIEFSTRGLMDGCHAVAASWESV